QYRQYLDSINYFQYFEENWNTFDNNLNITKNIFYSNYSSIPFDTTKKKKDQSDSETSSINSQDSKNTKRYKHKNQRCQT
ncbi:13267_t:CDS:2, partial [Gigaspora margarita]